MLRLFAGLFAVGSIIHGWKRLVENEEEVEPFFDQSPSTGAPTGARGGRWKNLGQGLVPTGIQCQPRELVPVSSPLPRRIPCEASLTLASCYLGFSFMLFLLLEKPDRPIRGWLNDWIDFLLLPFSVIATIGLLVFVADATLLCIRFVGRLSDSASAGWSGMVVREWAEALGFARNPAPEQPAHPDTSHGPAATVVPADRGAALPDEVQKAIGYLLGVKAIAALTNGVGPLIYYPAVALVLMFLSRNRAGQLGLAGLLGDHFHPRRRGRRGLRHGASNRCRPGPTGGSRGPRDRTAPGPTENTGQ